MVIEFEPAAQSDYHESIAWYERRSPAAALRFEDAVNSALRLIGSHPEQFPPTHGGCRRCNLRPFPFSLVFRVHSGNIKILAVAHAKRRADYWWNRL